MSRINTSGAKNTPSSDSNLFFETAKGGIKGVVKGLVAETVNIAFDAPLPPAMPFALFLTTDLVMGVVNGIAKDHNQKFES